MSLKYKNESNKNRANNFQDNKVGPEIPNPEEVYNPKYHKPTNYVYNDMFNPSDDEKNMAMFTHLAGFAMFVFPAGGSIIGPLIMWLTQREKSEFIDIHGKAALNFQISFMIYYILSVILLFISFGLLFFIPMIVGLVHIIYIILMSVKAKNGEEASCPLSFRFLK